MLLFVLQVLEARRDVYSVLKDLLQPACLKYFRGRDFWLCMAGTFVGNWVSNSPTDGASAAEKNEWRYKLTAWEKNRNAAIYAK